MMHLGPKVTALVDGRLSRAEEERCWQHVLTCPSCRVAVEREGWIKRELAGLSLATTTEAPDRLKGALADRLAEPASYPVALPFALPGDLPGDLPTRRRSATGLAAIGASSVGAAMFGVLLLGAPAQAPAPGSGAQSPARIAAFTPTLRGATSGTARVETTSGSGTGAGASARSRDRRALTTTGVAHHDSAATRGAALTHTGDRGRSGTDLETDNSQARNRPASSWMGMNL